MVHIGQEAIEKTGLCIIRVAWLIGFGMVNMVRDDVDLFGDDANREVLGNKPPEPVPEREGTVRAVAVVPHRAVRTHNDHAIKKSGQERPPTQETA